MDAYAEEIWKDRLSKDIDTSKITDRQSLLTELKKLPDKNKDGKDITAAKANLIKFVDSLFKSKTLEKTATSNIFKITSLPTLKKLDRRKPKIIIGIKA